LGLRVGAPAVNAVRGLGDAKCVVRVYRGVSQAGEEHGEKVGSRQGGRGSGPIDDVLHPLKKMGSRSGWFLPKPFLVCSFARGFGGEKKRG
jgi:hypothetical protein